MHSMIKRFCDDEAGSTAIEYALIGVLISIFIIVAVTGVATEVGNLFNKVETTMSSANRKL
jgi:pilus assembly protein Flp/PilA